jgi:hypothetical protein
MEKRMAAVSTSAARTGETGTFITFDTPATWREERRKLFISRPTFPQIHERASEKLQRETRENVFADFDFVDSSSSSSNDYEDDAETLSVGKQN